VDVADVLWERVPETGEWLKALDPTVVRRAEGTVRWKAEEDRRVRDRGSIEGPLHFKMWDSTFCFGNVFKIS